MRYALGVEYDGGSFQGWQGLGPSGPPTVQAALERALGSVADQAITAGDGPQADGGQRDRGGDHAERHPPAAPPRHPSALPACEGGR